MGRFHRHDDGTVHEHHHGDHPHDHSHHDHGDHSGYETGRERIEVLEDIFAENDHCAAHNREAFDAHNVQAINVMSSPGSGKTTVLQHVAAALSRLDLSALDLVLIENVGNLVCPAEFEVGEHRKLMVYAVTEGEDKPLKYPVMFRSVEAVVVNKVDLLPYLDFDRELFLANLEKVNPGVPVFEVSAKTGEGMAELLRWFSPELKPEL